MEKILNIYAHRREVRTTSINLKDGLIIEQNHFYIDSIRVNGIDMIHFKETNPDNIKCMFHLLARTIHLMTEMIWANTDKAFVEYILYTNLNSLEEVFAEFHSKHSHCFPSKTGKISVAWLDFPTSKFNDDITAEKIKNLGEKNITLVAELIYLVPQNSDLFAFIAMKYVAFYSDMGGYLYSEEDPIELSRWETLHSHYLKAAIRYARNYVDQKNSLGSWKAVVESRSQRQLV